MKARLNGSGLRRADWPLLLEIYLERHRATPFAWGTHDCVTFAIGWLELARADLDARAELAAQLEYRSAQGALAALDGRALERAVADWGRLTAVLPTFAQRGDLLAVDSNGRICLAICGGEVACAPGEDGLVTLPLATARAAWRV